MIHPIRYYGDPVLRRRATDVTRFDSELAQLAADMIETMYAADGVGLAAPQIGLPVRMFVALEMQPGADDEPDEEEGGDMADLTAAERRRRWEQRKEHVMINPTITMRNGVQYGRDGCLSLPGISVEDVRRDLKITIEYQDLSGARHELTTEGYFAHVLQHEFDHLEGILFFDHLEETRKRQFLEEHRSDLAEMQREAKAFLKSSRAQTVGAGRRSH